MNLNHPLKTERKKTLGTYDGPTSLLPIVYLPHGMVRVRFYVDSEAEFMRSILVHKVKHTWIPCVGVSQCRICSKLKDLPDRWPKKAKYRSREVCFCYAWIQTYDLVYHKVPLHQPILLWGFTKFGDGLSAIVNQLDDERLRMFYSPYCEFPLTRIESDYDRFDVTMALETRLKSRVGLLPDWVPPLSQCMFLADEEPEEQHVDRFIKRITQAYERSPTS